MTWQFCWHTDQHYTIVLTCWWPDGSAGIQINIILLQPTSWWPDSSAGIQINTILLQPKYWSPGDSAGIQTNTILLHQHADDLMVLLAYSSTLYYCTNVLMICSWQFCWHTDQHYTVVHTCWWPDGSAGIQINTILWRQHADDQMVLLINRSTLYYCVNMLMTWQTCTILLQPTCGTSPICKYMYVCYQATQIIPLKR